jgi:CxxC motif-containing protein (DUF1111 family)
LIEAIPAEEILRHSDPEDRDRDGISGRPNLVGDPESGRTEIGRFGWKAHVSTLHLFAGDAYLNEMGITNPTFPHENLPQGQPIPPEWDAILETGTQLEDGGEDVDRFTDFMRFLAPLQPRAEIAEARFGQRAFNHMGCANCHVPMMRTGSHPVAALQGQAVLLYSDLLLHDMGPDLADGIQAGTASGSEWRTTPLWGVSQKQFLLHDGRARTFEAAIQLHGGEAAASRDRFMRLAPPEQATLLAFLRSL